MKSKKNINLKAKIENNTLQPHDVSETIQNETILIYDLLSLDSNLTKTIVLPITGASYTISYNNKKDTKTNDSNFPEITLNGGKKYTVKINGLVEHFGGNNKGKPLNGVEYLVEAVKLGPFDLSGAFFGAVNLIKVPTKLSSGVTNMSNMFYNATTFNQPLNNWDVRNVEDMGNMFQDATRFNQPLNNWDVSSVTNMIGMFNGATNFNQSLNNWDVRNVEDMGNMFQNATSFNQPLNSWDVRNVEDMGNMFQNATSFNQPLNSWDVSVVINMSGMFTDATSFNQPLNSWDVSNVKYMDGMFQNATSFNQPLNNWVVSNVQSMGFNNFGFNTGMFKNAISFNQPLNNWNVRNVIDMSNMFNGATSFNQPLNNWDVSNVGTNYSMVDFFGSMNSMFANATSFNQSLHNWNLKDDIDCTDMLNYCGMSQYNYQNTLIGWYNNSKNVASKKPKCIGAKGMIYNKYNKWGVSNNTSSNGSISTTTSWILDNDSDKNIMRAAKSYFNIVGDMEVNFG